jgi:hypothetical protein
MTHSFEASSEMVGHWPKRRLGMKKKIPVAHNVEEDMIGDGG